ncbi:TPA: hypothetical protein ACT2IM_000289 [Streptococcus suis]
MLSILWFFGLVFYCQISLGRTLQLQLGYSLLACLIIFINAIRTFFFKEEKELTRMGYIFYIGLIVVIIYLKFILGK